MTPTACRVALMSVTQADRRADDMTDELVDRCMDKSQKTSRQKQTVHKYAAR